MKDERPYSNFFFACFYVNSRLYKRDKEREDDGE